jgi:hypothetical protein
LWLKANDQKSLCTSLDTHKDMKLAKLALEDALVGGFHKLPVLSTI